MKEEESLESTNKDVKPHSFDVHLHHATILSIRRKGPSTNRPASYRKIDRLKRIKIVIATWSAEIRLRLKKDGV